MEEITSAELFKVIGKNVKYYRKLYNLKIDSENYISVLERIELLIDIISTMKIADILIIPNLKLFLDDKDLMSIFFD